jgi:predicted metal-dependent peptidase
VAGSGHGSPSTRASFSLAYPYEKGDYAARGGGGTRIQAVEDYIQQQENYPDMVFLFTDGYSGKPTTECPERWTWILAPRGTSHSAPDGSRIARFSLSEIR